MGQEQEPTGGNHLQAFCACNKPGGNAGISIWRMPQHRVSLFTRFCPKTESEGAGEKRKFWNWIRNETNEERTLVLNGEISDETWYGDEVTPALFAEELNAGTGNITVLINSPGGDVFAAAQIYNMLMEYRGM